MMNIGEQNAGESIKVPSWLAISGQLTSQLASRHYITKLRCTWLAPS